MEYDAEGTLRAVRAGCTCPIRENGRVLKPIVIGHYSCYTYHAMRSDRGCCYIILSEHRHLPANHHILKRPPDTIRSAPGLSSGDMVQLPNGMPAVVKSVTVTEVEIDGRQGAGV